MKGIERHGNGYRFRLYLGVIDGKKKYQPSRIYPTVKEAVAARDRARVELREGMYKMPTHQTLATYFTDWLADKKLEVRGGTYRSYEWLIKQYAIKHLGTLKLEQLRPEHLQRLYRQPLENGTVSSRTIGHLHRVIKQALTRATKWGLVPRNVAELVTPPKVRQAEMKCWTEAEIPKFLDVAEARSRYAIVFELALVTGMRLGEILGLKWQDIDFGGKKILVNRTLSYTGKGYIFEEPKTKAGKRAIAVSELVLKKLKHHKHLQIKERLIAGDKWENNNDLVICTKVGSIVLQSNLRVLFKRLAKQAKVPVIRIHDLRHTNATLLIKHGTPIKVVQQRLGHEDIETTLKYYGHVVPGMEDKAVIVFDGILNRELS